MMPAAAITCIGEVLWDILPSGTFLGGAPFNTACDLHQLGFPAAMVSRVGADALGVRVIDAMRERGMATESVQTDPALPTGVVHVEFGAEGAPHYTIEQPSAWDAIELPVEFAAGNASAPVPALVVFGSLAQRSEPSRSTIRELCGRARMTVFDVNLRPPFDLREVVGASLQQTTILKLNRHEVLRLAEWFDLPVAGPKFSEAVAARFGCEMVCITRDAEGAEVWKEGARAEHSGFRVAVKDAVGAGDAFLAGFIAGLIREETLKDTLEYANLLGAFVAAAEGATPRFSEEELTAFARSAVRR